MTEMRFPLVYDTENPPQKYLAGTILISEGQPGDTMYVVMHGEVEILVGERIVETVGPEGLFGEMSLIDNEPRSAMARAKTDCELLPITQKQFLYMVQKNPFFSIEVMRVMSRRLRNKNQIDERRD